MAIQKQEFYEGAALHLLARKAGHLTLRYRHPYFVVNSDTLIYLKHSTGKRSPWAFTFTPDENESLREQASRYRIWIGLVCGSDGVAALDYERYTEIVAEGAVAQRVSCTRRHREHYEIGGPKGVLERKVAPSEWERLLDQ